MTELSLQQANQFLAEHFKAPLADIGGWDQDHFDYERDIYDGYQGFDITKTPLPKQYPTIISMDMLEHCNDPVRAAENIVTSLEDNGWLFITTVFSWEKHEHPVDMYRFTDTALEYLFRDLKIAKCWFETESGHPEMLTRVRVSLIGSKNG